MTLLALAQPSSHKPVAVSGHGSRASKTFPPSGHEARGNKIFAVSAYGARGNGVSDDTRALQDALDAAANAGPGSTVTSQPGVTFLVSHLTVRGRRLTLDLEGSTIKAARSTHGSLVTVAGSRDTLTHLTLDANRVSSEALRWQGANGTLRDAHLTNGPYLGLMIVNSALVTAIAVSSTRFGDVCFDVNVGTLIAHGDAALDCGYAGFFFSPTSTGNVLDGSSSHNSIGALIQSDGGHIAHFVSSDDNDFGVLMDMRAAHWSADYVETDNVGLSNRVAEGTGVELIGASDNSFNRVVAYHNPGYAFALTSASDHNTVASLLANDTGGWNTNPGLMIDTGSNANRIGRAAVIGHSVCLHIGETAPYTPSSGNWIGTLTAIDCPYDAIRIDYGNKNTIGHVLVVGCGAISNLKDEPYLGTVDFARRSSNNTIESLDQRPGASGTSPPRYALYFAPATHGNKVNGSRLGAWTVGPARDDGHNYAPFDASGKATRTP